MTTQIQPGTSLVLAQAGKFRRSGAFGEFQVRFGHPVRQGTEAEQTGFEHFLRVERQAF
jgi:hypothetical protein